jgi:hypothetical protein
MLRIPVSGSNHNLPSVCAYVGVVLVTTNSAIPVEPTYPIEPVKPVSPMSPVLTNVILT